MKRKIFILLFLAFVPLHFVLAQNDSILIRGYVRDNFTNAEITSGRAFFMNSDSVVLDSMPIRSWGGFRINCYDLAPVTSFTLGRSLRLQTLGTPSFHGLTGGVYKARERIHRAMADARLLANPASRSRVADSDPN